VRGRREREERELLRGKREEQEEKGLLSSLF